VAKTLFNLVIYRITFQMLTCFHNISYLYLWGTWWLHKILCFWCNVFSYCGF